MELKDEELEQVDGGIGEQYKVKYKCKKCSYIPKLKVQEANGKYTCKICGSEVEVMNVARAFA